MITNTKVKILGYIKLHGRARPHELTTFLKIGPTALHRQLKTLVGMDKLTKTGKSPLVFYVPRDGKQRVFDLISDNKRAFHDLGASRIGLFGSFVRNEQTDESDVDLLVDFLPGKKSYRNLLGIADLAEKLLGREVEIVTPHSMSCYIVPYIEKEIEYVQTT